MLKKNKLHPKSFMSNFWGALHFLPCPLFCVNIKLQYSSFILDSCFFPHSVFSF